MPVIDFSFVSERRTETKKKDEGLEQIQYTYKFHSKGGIELTVKTDKELEVHDEMIISVDFSDKQTRMKK